MTTVKLNTKDGEFEMSEELARMAPLLRDTIDESGTDELIPVETLSKEVMALVVQYLEKVKEKGEEPEIEHPLVSNDINEACTDEWFVAFINDREPEALFEMANAGVTLQMTGFTDLATLKIACTIKGKGTDEIRGFFGVANDFTPEEEQRIDEENKFAEGFF